MRPALPGAWPFSRGPLRIVMIQINRPNDLRPLHAGTCAGPRHALCSRGSATSIGQTWQSTNIIRRMISISPARNAGQPLAAPLRSPLFRPTNKARQCLALRFPVVPVSVVYAVRVGVITPSRTVFIERHCGHTRSSTLIAGSYTALHLLHWIHPVMSACISLPCCQLLQADHMGADEAVLKRRRANARARR